MLIVPGITSPFRQPDTIRNFHVESARRTHCTSHRRAVALKVADCIFTQFQDYYQSGILIVNWGVCVSDLVNDKNFGKVIERHRELITEFIRLIEVLAIRARWKFNWIGIAQHLRVDDHCIVSVSAATGQTKCENMQKGCNCRVSVTVRYHGFLK